VSTTRPTPAPAPATAARKKVTTRTFRQKKQRGEPITMLTAYDFMTARAVDQAGVDSILVGDSLGMVVLGYPNTLPVTMEEMLHHCKAVARGASSALLVGDMPFMSYQISTAEAVRNAGRFLQEAGMEAVKLEGGRERAEAVRQIAAAGIPVMGHIGLTPQSVAQFGGFIPQGKTAAAARRLIEDALDPAGGRLLQHRAGSGAGPAGRADQPAVGDSDHRHRRGHRLRRPGAGDPRPAGAVRPLHPQVRQAIPHPAPRHRRRADRVPGRGGAAAPSRPPSIRSLWTMGR
jgi:hypothetical protein